MRDARREGCKGGRAGCQREGCVDGKELQDDRRLENNIPTGAGAGQETTMENRERSGASKNVSYGYSVTVRNDSLFSYLPYFGRAYDVPYGGGKGLNFDAPIESYKESQLKNGQRHIEIGLKNDEDTYLYTINVFDNGSSSIDVQSRRRESISYSGEMEFDKH